MISEKFDVNILDKKYKIIAYEQPGQLFITHEIWEGDQLLFFLIPWFNESPFNSWRQIPGYSNVYLEKQFVNQIQEAIESHWL